jgi:hypothetical protein
MKKTPHKAAKPQRGMKKFPQRARQLLVKQLRTRRKMKKISRRGAEDAEEEGRGR